MLKLSDFPAGSFGIKLFVTFDVKNHNDAFAPIVKLYPKLESTSPLDRFLELVLNMS